MSISRKGFALVCGMGVAVLGSQALAQDWSDGFEAYSNGQVLFGVGGWSGWDGSQGVAGSATTARAHEGTKSVLIEPNDDAIHPFTGLTTGSGTMTAWMYLAQGDHVADTYYICQNEYADFGPYQWIIEVQFDVTLGVVLDDFRDETNNINIAYDQWAEITFDIDIDNDTLTTHYNGVELSTGQLFIRGGVAEFKNIDLYSTGATNYFDHLSVLGLGSGGGGFDITLTGPCPGQKTLAWTGAGSGQMGIVIGNAQGNTTIPFGPCQGTVLGIRGSLLLYNIIGTQGGAGQVSGTVGNNACDKFVQCINTGSCDTSNVAGPI